MHLFFPFPIFFLLLKADHLKQDNGTRAADNQMDGSSEARRVHVSSTVQR